MTRGVTSWRWPVAIGAVTVVGLVLALFVGGVVGAVAGWIGLGIPAATLTVGLVRKGNPEGQSS